ncbi:hypothetical protein [Sinomicrobium sp. M5D2P9]
MEQQSNLTFLSKINKEKMKTTTFISGLFTASILFVSCEFNKSSSKDFITGAVSKGDGINCDKVTIETGGQPTKNNQFVYGEKVNFVFENLTGFTKINDKTYPALSLDIVKNEKDTVLSYANLLADIYEGTSLSPLQLQANFTAALPYKNNEKYKAHIHIWDAKGKGNFTYKMPFTVKDAGLLTIESTGIAYSTIYLWNESQKRPVVTSEINQNEKFMLLLEGIKGLTTENDMVFPTLSLELKDREGTKILDNPNLFSTFTETGINVDNVAKQLSAVITFTQGEVKNPCQLIAILNDQKSDKRLKITTELKIK